MVERALAAIPCFMRRIETRAVRGKIVLV